MDRYLSPDINSDQEAVVVSSGDGNVYCLALKDGTELWRAALDAPPTGPKSVPTHKPNAGMESYHLT